MEQSLSELIQLSRTFGSDSRLAWAGSGNISVKCGDDSMLIKASGTELGRMNRKQGWRKVNLSKVRSLLDRLLGSRIDAVKVKKGLLDSCCDALDNAPMPSIETFFHALLGRCVVHLHPVAVLPYLCSKNGYPYLKKCLSLEVDFQWIDFLGLGVVTAGQILRKISQKNLNLSETHVFFLSNHGLVISCNSAAQAKSLMRQIVNCCEKHLPPTRAIHAAAKDKMTETAAHIQTACRQCSSRLANRITVGVKSLRTPKGLMPSKKWFREIITPEEWTYLHAGILWLQNDHPDILKKAISGHFRKTGFWPRAFYMPQRGLFISDQKANLPLYQQVFTSYLAIRGQAVQLGGLRPLARKCLSGEGLQKGSSE